MKRLVFILLITCLSSILYAQDRSIEAIAAYQMAEESMATQKYNDALRHIIRTKELLGTVNSKILYLEVQILDGLSNAGPQYLKDLQSAIHAFERASDIDQFSQEKRVEIAKLKVLVVERSKTIEDSRDQAAQLTLLKEEERREFIDGLPDLGIQIDEFLNHPYVKKYKKLLSEKEKKRLLNGKFVYVSVPFTDDISNERFINNVSTTRNGIVESYSLHIEIQILDLKEAIDNILGPTEVIENISNSDSENFYVKAESGIFIIVNNKLHVGSRYENGKMVKFSYLWVYRIR